MNELFSILIKSSISIGLLYLVYTLFLKRDTFFKTNRFYLVAAMLASVIIPFIDFSLFFNQNTITQAILLDPVIISSEGVKASISNNPQFYQVLLTIYLTGVAIFALRFIYQLIQLMMIVGRYGISRKEGMRIVFTDRNFSPFSFFNLVFLNTTDTQSVDTQKILAHEKVHIRQWHSLDLILLEI
ncbi:MAG TPA: hypothetical protein VK994_05800, partial [Bacteroidales bacterium]|nr:hypothetical protein [Bacteroidales bacterium]